MLVAVSRPTRIVYPGAWYHVSSQGTGVRPMFASREYGDEFLEVLAEVAGARGAEVHAYCLVEDAYHLLLRTTRANLPATMRQLNGQYAHWCRRRRGTDGRVFARRYHAILLEAEAWLLPVSRYLHLLPAEYGMVDDPVQYKWSSLRALGGRRDAPGWLNVRTVQRFAGGADAYLQYVAYGVDAETRALFVRERLPPVLGNPRIPSATARTDAAGGTSLARIVEAVAREFGLSEAVLRKARRGRGVQATPRSVAMLLARSQGGHPLSDIARAFGVRHASSVSVTVRRCRERLRHDDALGERVARVVKSL